LRDRRANQTIATKDTTKTIATKDTKNTKKEDREIAVRRPRWRPHEATSCVGVRRTPTSNGSAFVSFVIFVATTFL
jgi:hypothetical protein